MRILLGADFHLGARLSWLGEAADARREDLKRVILTGSGGPTTSITYGPIFSGASPARAGIEQQAMTSSTVAAVAAGFQRAVRRRQMPAAAHLINPARR